MYIAKDEPDRATRILSDYLKRQPDDYYRRLQLARLRYQMAELKDCAKQIDILEKTAGGKGDHLELLGDLFLTLGDAEKSVAAYSRALGQLEGKRLAVVKEKSSLVASNSSLEFNQGFHYPPVDEHPSIESYPPFPSVTESVVRNNASGLVRLLVRFDEKGRESDVLLLTRVGFGMDWRAVLWASNLSAEPARRGGAPVPAWTVVEVTFEVRGRGLDLRHERTP